MEQGTKDVQLAFGVMSVLIFLALLATLFG